MRTLKVTSGPAAGQSHDVEHELVIGREGADLTIEDPELSRRHVAVRPVERGVVVEDLGSLNGTFVNGERIGGEVTLTTSGSIRVGTTEISVELALVDVTRAQALPDAPDMTRARAIPDPDVTAPRRVPPAPEHMPPAQPPPQPPPPAQAPPQPAAAAPPPAPAAPAAPAAPPTAEEPPARPAPRAAPGGPPSGRPKPNIALGAVALLVVAVIVVLVLAQKGDSAKKHALSGTLNTGQVNSQGNGVLLGGSVATSPGGQGSAVVDQVFGGDLRRGRPVPASAKLSFRYDNGSVTSTLKATASPQPDGSVQVTGRGTITGGTGKFKDAKGSYTYNAARAQVATIKGTIEF